LFGFVVLGAAQLPTGILLVMSLFAVFLALVLGGMMLIVAATQLPLWVSVGSLVLAGVAALAARRLSDRTLFIAVCGTVVLGMICARLAISLVDFG
jgi:hypothetical protein